MVCGSAPSVNIGTGRGQLLLITQMCSSVSRSGESIEMITASGSMDATWALNCRANRLMWTWQPAASNAGWVSWSRTG